MGNKVALITDSTAYIPRDWIDKYGIKVSPAVVIWDGEELRDWYDITAEEFFTRLENSSTLPTTSQPTPAYFKDLYEELIAEGKDILGVHISSKLSGTFSSAEQAKAMMPDANIENVDTLSASMGEGWPLLMAVKAAQDGKSLAECRAVVEEACKHTGILLTVNTLEFLHRGGRIGGAKRLLGSALNLKPILQVTDGAIEPAENVRTRKKSLARLADMIIERIGDRRPIYMAAIHANAPEDAEAVLEIIGKKLPLKARMVTSVAPTVGTHTGPGTVGIAYMAGFDYES
ncbi:MAG TPA: DegV family protein [Anaerolineales bacterium]|jgi:DegV family protein with EDD domain|nr:DegV family protein [Anaerolineales bacterium]